MTPDPDNLVVIGKITGVHGVKGWLKVYSFTDPISNIFDYPQCYVRRDKTLESIEIDDGRRQGKGLVVHVAGLDDRDEARAYSQCEILVEKAELPALDTEEYYWHQLEGCAVISGEQRLGTVSHLIETGANDVLVVVGDAESIDRKERLIPWVPEQFVSRVDLEARLIEVDWDPEF